MNSFKKLVNSFKYAFSGINYAYKTQRNVKIHFVAAVIVLIVSYFWEISKLELFMLIFAISLVIITEMINTAIEKTIDLYTKEYNPLAKIAKNVAAGAVLVAAINAIIVAYLVFLK